MQWRSRGLWANDDFLKLWIGKTISNIGTGITGVALPLTAVLVLAATPAQMGILTALGGGAVLLVGLLAGVWVDRLRRRPILIVADLGRAALLLSIPIAAIFGILRIEQLYVVAALVGILSVFFTVADQSFLPSLIAHKDLVEGNSKLGISDSIAEITGPAIAGPLVQLVTAPLAVLFDASSFLFSALCIALIRKPEAAAQVEHQSTWREIVEGLRVVVENASLRALAASMGTFEFFGNFIGTMYVLYVVRELGAYPFLVGLLVATGGIGALVGAFLTEPAVRRFGLGPTIGGAALIGGTIQLLIPIAHGPLTLSMPLMFIAQLIGDIAIGVYLISEVSLRQGLIPTTMLGRANASMQFLTRGLGPVGALLAGTLGSLIGLRLTVLIGVLGIILASFWLLFSPIRKIRSL